MARAVIAAMGGKAARKVWDEWRRDLERLAEVERPRLTPRSFLEMLTQAGVPVKRVPVREEADG